MNILILLLWISGVCVTANKTILKKKALPPKKLPQHAYYYSIANAVHNKISYQQSRHMLYDNKNIHYDDRRFYKK
jgi:hypothetical protein